MAHKTVYVVLSTDSEGDSLLEYIQEFDKSIPLPSVDHLFSVPTKDTEEDYVVYQVVTGLTYSQLRAINTVLEITPIPV